LPNEYILKHLEILAIIIETHGDTNEIYGGIKDGLINVLKNLKK
jgi:hypothetical protein